MKTYTIQPGIRSNAISFKWIFVIFAQWIGAFVSYILSMIAANIISPFPQFIIEKIPETGFLSDSSAILASGFVNATILLWVARRSSFSGFKLAGSLFIFTFLIQTFQTQIETAYFISAFPSWKVTLKYIACSFVELLPVCFLPYCSRSLSAASSENMLQIQPSLSMRNSSSNQVPGWAGCT